MNAQAESLLRCVAAGNHDCFVAGVVAGLLLAILVGVIAKASQ